MRKQHSSCSGFRHSRREAMRIGSLGGLGLSLGGVLKLEAAQKHFESVEGTAKSVIQIILPGGIAAQETWNPKPESPIEYRGPFGINKTKVPGIVVGEMMPEIAKIAHKLTVVRSVVGKIPDHGAASYHMLRGHGISQALKHPTIGTVVNHEFPARGNLPSYIALGTAVDETGFLSSQYGPFTTGGDPAQDGFQVRDLTLSNGVDADGFESRKRIRDVINAQFRTLETSSAPLDAMDAYYKKAYEMISSQAVRDAFDMSKESNKLKDAYGRGKFFFKTGAEAGMRMMMARRLVEAGARFVSLRYGKWDDHSALKQNYLNSMPAFDHAFAALINDLDDRGMLDSTLVWVVSEFGRTPKINSVAGRDHWSRVFSIAMAGGGLKPGAFYGDSDATSSDVADYPVPLADLHSTIYKLIGIVSDKELMASGSRPIEIVNDGKPIEAIIA